jgi:predicted signal transduction protein with EAL and GGDEF domain
VCFPEFHSRNPHELLQLADAALYEAKRLGRNCCLLYCAPGRYVDAKGREIDTDEGREAGPPRAPQVFA